MIESLLWIGVPAVAAFTVTYWLSGKIGRFIYRHSKKEFWSISATALFFLAVFPILCSGFLGGAMGILNESKGADYAEIIGLIGIGPVFLISLLSWFISPLYLGFALHQEFSSSARI